MAFRECNLRPAKHKRLKRHARTHVAKGHTKQGASYTEGRKPHAHGGHQNRSVQTMQKKTSQNRERVLSSLPHVQWTHPPDVMSAGRCPVGLLSTSNEFPVQIRHRWADARPRQTSS